MINLYESTAIDFSSNGLGHLTDAVSCLVLEERNGEFELEMEYPITGRLFDEISQRRIITAKSNPYSTEQAFRIYSITKPINGIVTINAAHICYDLTGYPVSPFTAESIGDALIGLSTYSVVDCPFTFTTDKSTVSTMTRNTPSSIKSTLGGTDGSILSVYGGEYEYNNFNVKLWNNRGLDRGVTIRYGKNLTDLEQEENCSNLYTGVYPFWYSEEEGLMELTDKIVYVDGTYDFTKIYSLDLSDTWQEKPTEEELLAKAEAYISNNNIGIPKVSLTVSFIQLSQSEEYKNFVIMEMVKLCDTVTVEFPELNVDATSQCISTTYNALTDRYESVQLGEATSNLATSLVEQSETISQIPTKTFMDQAILNATNLITGGLGGYVVLHSSAGQNHPDEILIMDTDNIETAINVWRWNQNGLGFSSTGYSGSYATAMTIDGKIVADFIQTGTLSANMITTGILKSANNNVYFNLDTGKMVATEGVFKGDITGSTGTFSGQIETTSDVIVGNNIQLAPNSEQLTKSIFIDANTNIAYSPSDDGTYSLRLSTDSWLILSSSSNTDHTVTANAYFTDLGNAAINASGIISINAGENIFLNSPSISSSTTITVSSDERLKDNIHNVETDWIYDLEIKQFTYLNDDSKDKTSYPYIGIIAQSVLETNAEKYIIDSNIYYNEDQTEKGTFYSVDYQAVSMALVQEVQKLERRVTELEKNI